MFWLLVIVFSLCTGFIYWNCKRKNPLKCIPGPKGLPILGNILDIKSDPKKSLDHLYHLSQQYDGIFKMNLGPLGSTVLISDPQYLQTLLCSPIHVNKGGWYHLLKDWIGDGIAITNGKKWKNTRKLLGPIFSTKVLEGFCRKFDEKNREFVDELRRKSKGTFDISHLIQYNSYQILMSTLIGENSKPEVAESYLDNSRNIMKINMGRLFSLKVFDSIFKLSEDYKKAQYSIENLRKIIKDFLRKRRLHKKNIGQVQSSTSFLDLLLELQNQYPDIADEEIVQHIDTFIFAGQDTLAATQGLAIHELSSNREMQEKLLAESNEIFGKDLSAELTLKGLESAEYLTMFCKEVFRKYPAAPMIARITTEPLKLGDIDIPVGTNIFILIYCMHRTPKYYPDPMKFIPERFISENQSPRSEYALATFSHGPRNCIGQRFAMLEMKSVITTLVRNFIFSKDPDFEVSLGAAGSLIILNGVHVKIQERFSTA